MATIGNMTIEDLKRFVEETVDARLTRLLGDFEITDEIPDDDDKPWDTIRASVERQRWTPPANAKSSLEFLREDREN